MPFVTRLIKLCSAHRLVIFPALGILVLGGWFTVHAVTNNQSGVNDTKTTEVAARKDIEAKPDVPKTGSNSKKEKDGDETQQSRTSSPGGDTTAGSSGTGSALTQRSIVDEKGPQPAPDPKPDFELELLPPPSNNAFGFILKANIARPLEITEFSTPEVLFGSAGAPRCDNSIYYIDSNDSWGFSCTMYSSATYGQWPVTFRVTAKNIYNQTATRSVTGVIVYRANQTQYENILKY